MNQATGRGFLLLLPLVGLVFFSGCTGIDPVDIAKGNQLIQQFLKDHPNAEIKVTHFTAEQAKNIIDQIRSDCDNPYLDEKELYRVNVTDNSTNFYATAWIDWNNKTIECVYKIGTEGKVLEKPKVNPGCASHNSSRCDSGHLYWFDSCGNKQDKKEYCPSGCLGEKCTGECKSKAEARCYGDHVYWFDSCGNKQDKKEYCNYGCNEGFCKPKKKDTCEEAGGYCIWPANISSEGSSSTGMIISIIQTTTTSTLTSYKCKDGYETGNYFCKEGGICCIPKTECADSDGGKNYFLKGTVSVKGQSASDHCNDDGSLTEKFCYANEIKAETYKCPNSCKDGACLPGNCTNECSDSGLRVCSDSSHYKICGYFDVDSCLEWGMVTECMTGHNCTEGQCPANCTNQCNQTGSRVCSDSSHYKKCGEYDSDSCLEWSEPLSCPNCTNGECLGQNCTNDCLSGQKECSDSTHYKTCGNHDSDSCLEWSGLSECGQNQTCSNGSCSEACSNDCSSGAKECTDSSHYKTCGNYDSDSCLEWSEPASCPNCSAGECIQQTASLETRGFMEFQILSPQFNPSAGILTFQLKNTAGRFISITSVSAAYQNSSVTNTTPSGTIGENGVFTYSMSGLPVLPPSSSYSIDAVITYANLDTGLSGFVSPGKFCLGSGCNTSITFVKPESTGFPGFEIPAGGFQYSYSGQVTILAKNMVGAVVNITNVSATYTGPMGSGIGEMKYIEPSANLAQDSTYTAIIPGQITSPTGLPFHFNVTISYVNLFTMAPATSSGSISGTTI